MAAFVRSNDWAHPGAYRRRIGMEIETLGTISCIHFTIMRWNNLDENLLGENNKRQ